jgi:hypothetical protein
MAEWHLYEYMRGNFYFYSNTILPSVRDIDHLEQIISGKDPNFETVLMKGDLDLSRIVTSPFRVIQEVNLGSIHHKRSFKIVKGLEPSHIRIKRKSN